MCELVDIVAMAQAGSREAEDTILRQYTPHVKSQIRKRFPTHRPISDDAVQEGLMGLLEAVRTFDPEKRCPFLAWANKLIFRRVLRHLVSEREYCFRHGGQLVEGKYSEDEPGASLSVSLGCLDDRERLIVEMHYGFTGDEMTLAQIGEQIGITKQRVDQIHQAALHKLRIMNPGNKGT